MTFAHQRIQKDTTQALKFSPPVTIDGAISAATVDVRIPDEDFSGTFSAASPGVDSVDGTLDAAASKGDQALSTAASLTVGNRYLVSPTLQSNDDNGFTVEVDAEQTDGDFHLRTELPVALPSGAPIVARTVTHALTAAQTDQLGFGLAKWKLTIGGVVYAFDQVFEVVDRITAWALDRDTLLELLPRLADLRFPSDPTWEKGIRAAWYSELAPALGEAGIATDRIESWEVLNAAHAQFVFARTVQQLGDQFDERFVSAQWERAGVMLRQALKSRDWWLSESLTTVREPHPGEADDRVPAGGSIEILL